MTQGHAQSQQGDVQSNAGLYSGPSGVQQWVNEVRPSAFTASCPGSSGRQSELFGDTRPARQETESEEAARRRRQARRATRDYQTLEARLDKSRQLLSTSKPTTTARTAATPLGWNAQYLKSRTSDDLLRAGFTQTIYDIKQGNTIIGRRTKWSYRGSSERPGEVETEELSFCRTRFFRN